MMLHLRLASQRVPYGTLRMSASTAYLSTASLSKATGLGREALRFYESRGLIKPTKRTAAGYRQYSKNTVERIAFIKQTQLAGFTLKEIKHLLQLNSEGTDNCGTLSEVFDGKQKELEKTILELQTRKETLRNLVKTCEQQDIARSCDFVRKGSGC